MHPRIHTARRISPGVPCTGDNKCLPPKYKPMSKSFSRGDKVYILLLSTHPASTARLLACAIRLTTADCDGDCATDGDTLLFPDWLLFRRTSLLSAGTLRVVVADDNTSLVLLVSMELTPVINILDFLLAQESGFADDDDDALCCCDDEEDMDDSKETLVAGLGIG